MEALWRRSVKRGLIAGGLTTANILARAGLMREARGRGAIFTLHHVRPHVARPIEPNGHLEVNPEFLDAAIIRLRQEGYDFIGLSDIPDRLTRPQERPFACFTLDDGYRNNVSHALPIFERHQVPFTIFINEGFADRTHSIWWETLAELLTTQDGLAFDFGDGEEEVDLSTPSRKLDAFDRFAQFMRNGCEASAVAMLDACASAHGIEPLDITASLTMPRQELLTLSRHPLASLGAHTVSHRALARLSEQEASREMRRSANWLEALTGKRPSAIAYPYGSPSAVTTREQALALTLGFKVGVTTQPGTVNEKSAAKITALPRISLNGYYQEPHYVAALASGIPFAMRGL
ncbi:polysaccharide deacetylase family protein [Rhizobium oryzicola]|uniref:Chitooligosaccharide deacetylase n=1 Tax=Rhizobium oryzicola TaxID=1232668 RepID=A0ABT8SSA8_9HYPH|nr:polysaccharide deacetylase family protein [Rhizobium oryzicola]MDO1581292.1 polysaccharide deacetylase family protein [Rhizobium oryzicola]